MHLLVHTACLIPVLCCLLMCAVCHAAVKPCSLSRSRAALQFVTQPCSCVVCHAAVQPCSPPCDSRLSVTQPYSSQCKSCSRTTLGHQSRSRTTLGYQSRSRATLSHQPRSRATLSHQPRSHATLDAAVLLLVTNHYPLPPGAPLCRADSCPQAAHIR